MKRRRNPIIATRPLSKRDRGEFFAPPPAVLGGLRGYKPAGLVYDREPTSLHPKQALEGFGVLIVPEVVSYQAPHRVGYQVLNQNSGLPLHEGYFKKAEIALDFADQVLIRYPCFFAQSAEEQRRDERYWDVNNRKHFPKLLESDLYLAPPVEDVKGFRTGTEAQRLQDKGLKKFAELAGKLLKEKFGKDWRKKGQFRVVHSGQKLANPGKFYVYLNSGGSFGPLDSLREAEAAGALYLLREKDERAVEIRQRRPDGSTEPAAHIITVGPLGGVHYRIHN